MSSSPPRLGVCSWSLQPESPADLVAKVKACGLSRVQLALNPLREGQWSLDQTRETLQEAGIEIVSGMLQMIGEDYSSLAAIAETGGLRLDAHFADNLCLAEEVAAIASELELELVTFHAGFLPHEKKDPEREKLVGRLRDVVDRFATYGIKTGFETGQEQAETLLGVLEELDHPSAGVNFDPANMILYAMGDPVEALRSLAPHVLQIHIKDALETKVPGTWGEEVRVGTGQVRWSEFFSVVSEAGLSVDYCIEREAGEDRIADVCAARELVTRLTEVPA